MRRFLRYFDLLSFCLICVISLIGLLCVFSATYQSEQPFSIFFIKQTFGLITGLIGYFFCCFIDYRTMQRWWSWAYFITLTLLIFTLIKGSIKMGGQRWINLGFTKFQPSELTKLFFPAFFSAYLEHDKRITHSLKSFLPLIGVLFLSFLLILKQPDLGTAVIILLSGLCLLWCAGLTKKFFIIGALFCCISAPLLWKFLKPYQKQRIAVFLGGGDIKKERYQLEQSLIAIGSGGLLGKGFLQGTQNKLNFLPESRTDFIFSVLCEEGGFVSAFFVMLLYFILFTHLLLFIPEIKDFYTQLFALGLLIHLILSALINMFMVTGLAPIVGIPLPLFSYGITNLWISFASLGTLQSIIMRRNTL
ncbi:MAG: FtsW/RodA/SpoVE family cell cycle protein [Candidatus Babeliaceae bacterium]